MPGKCAILNNRTEELDHSSVPEKHFFRGKVKMFCCNDRTNVYVAEIASAAFLCPDFTLPKAPVEEYPPYSHSVRALLSDDTPVDVLSYAAEAEYEIVPAACEQTVISIQLPLNDDCPAAFSVEIFNSADVISVIEDIAEWDCPMFQFRKHIPSNFYITVCNGDFYTCQAMLPGGCDFGYCSSVRGFLPGGMELKIRVQSFKL